MGYDLRIELLRATPARDVLAALSALPDARVRDARRLAFTVDTPRAAGRARFSLEARDRTWLGRVRAVDASLPFGGSRDEASVYARAVSDLARRLGGTVIDPQLGYALPPDAEVEWIVDGWAEANLRALEGYEQGWIVRPDAVPVQGEAVVPVEATRSDLSPDGPLSLARAYLRAGDAARARAALERVDEDERTRAVEREVARLEALGGDRAQAALQRVAPSDAPALVEALRDHDTRERAVTALGRLGAAATGPLLEALADEDLRDGATDALAALPGAAAAYTDCLHRGTRAQAEGALAALDDLFLAWGPDAAALDMAIARLLDEPDLDAGPGLASALERAGALGAPGVRAILRLLDGAPRHVAAAADALGALRALPALEPLLARLLGPNTRLDRDLDDDALAGALARIDPAAAGARLAAALDALDPQDDPERRSRLLHALVEVDAARAVPLLVDAVRRAAASDPADSRVSCPDDADFVLATWVHDPAALPAVLAALDDPLPAVRRALASALASIGGADARAALTRLANDLHADVRAEALRGLSSS